MSESCALSFTQFLPSLASVIIGGLIGFLSANFISKRAARAAACVQFRSIMVPDVIKMEMDFPDKSTPDLTYQNHELQKYVRERFQAHIAAIEEFRPFIGQCEKVLFKVACDKYISSAKMGIARVEQIKKYFETCRVFVGRNNQRALRRMLIIQWCNALCLLHPTTPTTKEI